MIGFILGVAAGIAASWAYRKYKNRLPADVTSRIDKL